MLRSLLRNSFNLVESAVLMRVPVRTNKIMRTPVTDTSKFVPLVDETQLFVPVVHRRHGVPLRKVGGPYKKQRGRHQVFDEVVIPPQHMPDVEVILIQDVPGKGVKGSKMSVRGDKAYAEFLLPQYAVYASPENLAKYASLIESVAASTKFSTLSAQKTAHNLTQLMVFFHMNMKNPWTIEKWHARAAFRQSGIILSDDCIQLPSQPISGPDPEKQGKHFFVTITINGKEQSPVLCRINHFINDDNQTLPVLKHFTPPVEPVFEEDREKIEAYLHQRDLVKKFKC